MIARSNSACGPIAETGVVEFVALAVMVVLSSACWSSPAKLPCNV